MGETIRLFVDGEEIEAPAGVTVLQACELAGREVPVFCYHSRLSVAGNCRMCLVEVEGGNKPVASCAMPAGEGMKVKTKSPMVEKARKGVLELLLVNHPLDCPICDQGGECDLQDLTLFYGPDHSRFEENKRPVVDKDIGPLISTHMTRCIHCTRCIRFSTEIAGVPELGAMGRGEHMEVGTYVEKAVSSELSGNLIDICPVGALNSKPYEYRARVWELAKTESIDVHDALGANIRIDARGEEVMRITPRLFDDVNQEWISDKSRFAVDGLAARRLDRPWLRRDGTLEPVSWREAFAAIEARIAGRGSEVGFLLGELCALEEMAALGDLAAALGSPHVDCRVPGAAMDPAWGRASYLFNPTVAGIDRADAMVLIGCDPRAECAVANARIGQRARAGDLVVGRIGGARDLTYPVEELGAGPPSLEALIAGDGAFAERLARAERPMIVLGSAALERSDGEAVLAASLALARSSGAWRDDWRGFAVLQRAASRVGGLDLALVPGEGGLDTRAMVEAAARGELAALYLMGVDDGLDFAALRAPFVIYQGHHGDRGASVADVILPGAAYTEKSGGWISLEGRPQRGARAVFPPGEAKEDWRIVRALAESLGHALPYDDIDALRRRIAELAPHAADLDAIARADFAERSPRRGEMSAQPFAPAIEDFYRSNPICRASQVMAACSAQWAPSAEAAHG